MSTGRGDVVTEPASIQQRTFGRSGVAVSILGMGCSRLGAVWQGRSDEAGRRAVAAAIANGINFFDTADAYGRGRSERLLGAEIRGHRDDVLVATKCGLIRTPTAVRNAVAALLKGPAPFRANRGGAPQPLRTLIRDRRLYSPGYIVRATEASLQRLETDRIDVLLLHSPSIESFAAEETAGVMERLKTDGKVRFWGVSARGGREALAALRVPGLDCVELELSLCHMEALEHVIPQAATLGVAVIARQPFASGALLSAARDRGISTETVLRCCFQFLLGVAGVTTGIAGMTRPDHVQQNVAALGADVVPPDKVAEVRALCGEREHQPGTDFNQGDGLAS
jgi:aryl-alcohol dehydrogenase-like predicted oxidoreductase